MTTVLHSRGIQKFTLLPLMLDGLSHPAAAGASSLHIPHVSLPVPILLYLLLGAVPIWNIFKALHRSKYPEAHPLVRRLQRYGSIADVARAIDADWSAGVTKIMPAEFTASWLIVSTFYTCIAVPLDEIVWIYERVYVTHGRSYSVCLRDRRGGSDEFTCALFQVSKILAHITRFRPWIVSGYSGQAAVDFATNRAQFIAEVDRSRQQHLAVSVPPPPYTPYSP